MPDALTRPEVAARLRKPLLARALAARAVGPGFDFLRAELRVGHPVPQGALLAAWETMTHDA